MKRTHIATLLLASILILLLSCTSRKEGALEGSVVTPVPGMRVTVSQNGKPLRAVDIDSLDGKFRIILAPGMYDISVSTPASPFPATFSGIMILSNTTTTLPPVEAPRSARPIKISGKVVPSVGTTLSLLSEGKERAAVNARADGKYEFIAVPAGNYILRTASPGYAVITEEVQVTDEQEQSRNIRLLYASSINGVDWNAGTIRATGKGRFPPDAPNPTIMREMAKRAALSDGERNLVKIVEQIKIDSTHDIKSSMTNSFFSVKIRGYLQGFKVVAERDIDDGVELDLELPLTGRNGLTSLLAE